MTVEDPIEFLHRHKRAWSTSARSARTPSRSPNALKHVLRQDPDVILVGEMRDLETISIALTAAETGHLVFATLHTQDAAQTIDRIIDVFPPHQQQQVRVQLAGALQGVVCQQLCQTRRRARAGSSRPRCWSPRRRSATSSARARPTRSTRPCRPARSTACTPWTSTSPTWSSAASITYETGLERCHHAEDFNRLAGRGLRGSAMAADTDLRVHGPRPGAASWSPGKLEAETQAASSASSGSMGYAPDLRSSADRRRHEERDQAPGLRRQVKLKDLAVFSRQFATMINSGLSLLRALTILAEQTENKELARGPRRGAQRRRERAPRCRRRWPSTRRSSPPLDGAT